MLGATPGLVQAVILLCPWVTVDTGRPLYKAMIQVGQSGRAGRGCQPLGLCRGRQGPGSADRAKCDVQLRAARLHSSFLLRVGPCTVIIPDPRLAGSGSGY